MFVESPVKLKCKILLELINGKAEFVDLSCSVKSVLRLLQMCALSEECLVVMNIRIKLLVFQPSAAKFAKSCSLI